MKPFTDEECYQQCNAGDASNSSDPLHSHQSQIQLSSMSSHKVLLSPMDRDELIGRTITGAKTDTVLYVNVADM
jgi:hypothetical protein